MSREFVHERDLRFLLHEVHDLGSLTAYPYFEDHDRETFDLVLNTALKMARDRLFTTFRDMDQNPPCFVDGAVRVHPMVADFMKECGDGGWISATAPYDLGGQQLPRLLISACVFVFAAANYSASVYPMLTSGAARLIESFGSEDLKRSYIPNMFEGKWQGTMALTEPQAGSSLADITTQAQETGHGYFLIKGQKIFISASDHDGVENVINLMLARIKGAPAGVKGISLFVVPKKRVREDGSLVPNDLHIAGLYHKLGYRGAPIAQLSMGENDDCRGFLVGKPHMGLQYMFQMMNETRLEVGLGAAAIASAAYHAAVRYCKERTQGRRLAAKQAGSPPVPIIEHADVKRMLLFQRAIVEGSLSLGLQCCKYSDLSKTAPESDALKFQLLLELLTPAAKTFPSEMGILSVSQGLQCLGGYGYCDEFPLEQYYRDVRIHPIHEGTTGIHGIDLLGRKVVMKDGQALDLFRRELEDAIKTAEYYPELKPYAERLDKSLERLLEVTESLIPLKHSGRTELFLADATLYLEFFGLVAIAWQWLLQGTACDKMLKTNPPQTEFNFYQGKLYTMRYFFHYELPKTEALAKRLTEADGLTTEMHVDWL
ncbi:MAG: acyl-CoA dehydrogenase [Desulfomonilaceae bacterium]|nr:acyl-CoA dehydrogenase [Desulfomonilaceae bacterium]